MKSLSAFHHPSGLIIRIKAIPTDKEWNQLGAYLDEYSRKDTRVHIDLNRMAKVSEEFFAQLMQYMDRFAQRGLNVVIIRTEPDLKSFIHDSGASDSIAVLEYLDEALFPNRPATRLPMTARIQDSARKTPPTPSPEPKPTSTPKDKRRRSRENVSLPFFYTQVTETDILAAPWNCAVTEEMDIQSFSGLGFFVLHPIMKGKMLKIIFPTVSSKTEPNSLSTLTLFSGRVKNCISVGRFHRIGVALIDVYEYEGRFEARETIAGTP